MKKTHLVFTMALIVMACKKTAVEKGPGGNTEARSATDEFSIVAFPDTQYYTNQGGGPGGGTTAMFVAECDWIQSQHTNQNIVYVAGLGDITDSGDDPTQAKQWDSAWKALSRLESPVSIPYGTCVGNHDNFGTPLTNTTVKYNQFFGVSHFSGRPYYGGNYNGAGGNNNDSHYDLFTAGGINFIVIYIEFDDNQNQDQANMNNWAFNLLSTYSSRKAIIVSHSILLNSKTDGVTYQAPWTGQGRRIYDRLKAQQNVFMMLCGHVYGAAPNGGEGERQDVYNGRTIKSYLTDYQARVNGGNGYMRIYTFNPSKDIFSAKTYSPYQNAYEVDEMSEFTRPLFHSERSSRFCDFAQDGKSDCSFFNNGVWKVYGQSNTTNGQAGDIPVPADYNGDGQTEYAVWRPSTGEWIIPGRPTVSWGLPGDIPVPGDYDNDGKADPCVFRPGTVANQSTWYYLSSNTGGGHVSFPYGTPGDIPIPGNWEGTGTIPGLYRPSTQQFFRWGDPNVIKWGYAGDIPVPGDYNGDGWTDLSLWRPSTGVWYVYGQGVNGTQAGQPGDIPAPGDYDGDGITDEAVYRNGVLYIPGGTSVTLGNVAGGDKLLNLPYSVRNYYFP